MRIIRYLFVFAFIVLSNTAVAQDEIFLKNGERITAFVVEKSERNVSYKLMNSDNSPIIILKTEKVAKIVFRNGKEMILPRLIRMEKRFGVNGGLIFGLSEEGAFYKIGADYYVFSGVSGELNGLISSEGGGGMELGAKYYFDPYNSRKLKGYTGILAGAFNSAFYFQVPFGVNYVGEKGFDFKLGLRGFYRPKNSELSLYSELTVGWRF